MDINGYSYITLYSVCHHQNELDLFLLTKYTNKINPDANATKSSSTIGTAVAAAFCEVSSAKLKKNIAL